MTGDGWIKLHRIMKDKPIWKCSTPEQKVILITLLLMVNHEDAEWEWKGNKYKVTPGQKITSLDSIAKESGKGITIQNVRTALNKFESYGFLTNVSTKTGRLVTIENWHLYQTKEENQQSNQQTPNKELTSNKNNKNDRNLNNNKGALEKTDYQIIVDMYNSICLSFPKVTRLSSGRISAIKARLNTYNVEDFKTVFAMAEESNFLKGENDRKWSATFDWLIKDSNMKKVLEGNYQNKEKAKKGDTYGDSYNTGGTDSVDYYRRFTDS